MYEIVCWYLPLHTEKKLPIYFTDKELYFSLTFRKFFTNILFLSKYFTNITTKAYAFEHQRVVEGAFSGDMKN